MADPQHRLATRLTALVLLVAIGGLAVWRAARPPADHRLPAAQAEAWMADCLPGIGPVTREAMAAAIRSGDLEALPARARPVARRVFSFDPSR